MPEGATPGLILAGVVIYLMVVGVGKGVHEIKHIFHKTATVAASPVTYPVKKLKHLKAPKCVPNSDGCTMAVPPCDTDCPPFPQETKD
jgi:hypothetical protein